MVCIVKQPQLRLFLTNFDRLSEKTQGLQLRKGNLSVGLQTASERLSHHCWYFPISNRTNYILSTVRTRNILRLFLLSMFSTASVPLGFLYIILFSWTIGSTLTNSFHRKQKFLVGFLGRWQQGKEWLCKYACSEEEDSVLREKYSYSRVQNYPDCFGIA